MSEQESLPTPPTTAESEVEAFKSQFRLELEVMRDDYAKSWQWAERDAIHYAIGILDRTKAQQARPEMTKQESVPEIASTREFWILEPKNPKEQKPYPTCYRREPTWGCEPLPKDDPFNEVIHVREVIENAPTATPTAVNEEEIQKHIEHSLEAFVEDIYWTSRGIPDYRIDEAAKRLVETLRPHLGLNVTAGRKDDER